MKAYHMWMLSNISLRKYGIEVVEKEETAEDIAARQRSESLYLVSDFAHKFFQQSLKTPEGQSIGYAYFKNRGLEDATIEKYGLGWAPKSRHALADEALAKGYKEEYLVDTGLCIKRDDGRLSDRFYDRVVFPIHSVSGRVIAFGCRTLRTDYATAGIGKYVNSPETEIYDKSRSLYGIWFAKGEIARKDKCFLVEGYLDVLSMHQLGITNVVASSGTSLTTPQIRLIKKFTDNVTIMYDGDSAGIHAAIRGLGMILKEGMKVKVVLIPDGDDPDSYARKHTLEEVQSFIDANERDFIDFKTELLIGEIGNDPLKKADLINDIADTIALIPDAVTRTVYAQSSADRFNIDQKIIFSRIAKTRETMLENDRKTAQRERERAARQREQAANNYDGEVPPPPDMEYAPIDGYEPSVEDAVVFENPIMQPAERDLLTFILKDGLTELDFPDDTEFYDPDSKFYVAEFIRDVLEEDHCVFSNSVYRRAYDAYFALYDSDSSLTQDQIVKALMDGEDRAVANITADLVQDRYQLTVEYFRSSMTADSTRLATFVPRAILVYQSKTVVYKMDVLREELKTADADRQIEILTEIQRLSNLRKLIDEKLGRIH